MESVPLIDRRSIIQAAEEMISDYGQEAFEKATERAQALRSEGFISLSHTWDLIGKAIEERQSGPKAYLSALKSNVALSE